jgi:hypothetical protein
MLAVVIVCLVVGGANFYGYQWLQQKEAALRTKVTGLKTDQLTGEIALQKLPIWQKRKGWVDQHEPSSHDEGDSKAQLLETALKGARDQHLEVVEQALGDTQASPVGSQINISLKVKGSMQDLCKWLTVLENPQSFYAVMKISLKADQDQKSMDCSLQIARFFKTATSSP